MADFDEPLPPAPAAEQATYLSGRSHDATLHEQLYRYADDLQQLMERQAQLEQHNATLRDACTSLNAANSAFDTLFSHSHDILIVTDAQGRVIRCNRASMAIARESMLAGSELRYWLMPGYRDNYDTMLARALAAHPPETNWELQFRRDQPGSAPLIVSAQAFSDMPEGPADRVHWILRDITRLREIQFEAQITSMVFKNTAEGVMITDLEGEILAVNPAFSEITGYAAAEVIGRRPNMLRSGVHGADFYAQFWRALREQGSWQGEIYNRKKSGQVYPQWLSVNAARDEQGHLLSYVAVFSDLTQKVKMEQQLVYLAHHDTLTGLPNRLLLNDRLSHAIVQAKRSGTPFSLLFIDLDGFKPVNDQHGHEIGDIVLKEIASRLVGALREVDTVARFGGDEFVIVAPGLAGELDIARIGDKLLAALAAPIEVAGEVLQVGGSLGCAAYPDHAEDAALLLKYADAAMYRAKTAGGNRCVIHDTTREPATPLSATLPASSGFPVTD